MDFGESTDENNLKTFSRYLWSI